MTIKCRPFFDRAARRPAVDFRRDPSRPRTLPEFVPNADALGNTETAMRECYGYVFSVLTGR